MRLPRHESQTFHAGTVSVSGRAFVGCHFSLCTLVLRDGPYYLESCTFDRCNWHVDRLVSWSNPVAHQEMVGLVDVIRRANRRPDLADNLGAAAELAMHPVATHLPMLMACVARTAGPVLELGCGHYSTPILHQVCAARELASVESDPRWMSHFSDLASPSHQFFASNVKGWELPDRPWDVAFIDHAPHRRAADLAALMNRARLLVVHDVETKEYGYEPTLSQFKYRFDYRRYVPWTTVVSQFVPLDWLGR